MSTKLYIITSRVDYEGEDLISVWSTFDKAMAAFKQLNEGDDRVLYEIVLDSNQDPTQIRVEPIK